MIFVMYGLEGLRAILVLQAQGKYQNKTPKGLYGRTTGVMAWTILTEAEDCRKSRDVIWSDLGLEGKITLEHGNCI